MSPSTTSARRSVNHAQVLLQRRVAMDNPPRRPAFFWLVVCTIPLYAALWLFSGHVLVREFHHSKAFGWTMKARDTGWVVATVDERGPAAGRLAAGARLLPVNGYRR